ncbi:MAG: hypothetical protein ACLS3C_11060 [Oscillospiraceae bacterium]
MPPVRQKRSLRAGRLDRRLYASAETSVIYHEDPKTGQDVVLRKLYGGANRDMG